MTSLAPDSVMTLIAGTSPVGTRQGPHREQRQEDGPEEQADSLPTLRMIDVFVPVHTGNSPWLGAPELVTYRFLPHSLLMGT